MTKFLHWRKMTWALVVCSAAMPVWLAVGGTGTMLVAVAWLLAAAALGLTWFITQPLVRKGRGLGNGFFVKPGPGHWRLVDLHRGPVKAH